MTATETVTTNPPSARKRIGPADLIDAAGLAESSSGAILYDETIRQHTTGGVPFAQALAEATGRPWKQRNGNRDLPWTAYSLGRTETGRGPDRGRTVVT